MDTFCDNYHDDGPSDSCTKVSLGCITSLTEGADCISHTAYFSVDVVCKGTIYVFKFFKLGFAYFSVLWIGFGDGYRHHF